MNNYLIRLGLLCLVLSPFWAARASVHIVKAEEGKAILDEVDFETDFARIEGEWEFYYQQFLSPLELNHLSNEEKNFEPVPGFWKHYGKDYSRFGYATYKLNFTLSEDQLNTQLALRVNNIHNAFKIWLNGELISEVGIPGESYGQSVAMWLPVIIELSYPKTNNELVIHISNYRHRNGGIQDALEIGNASHFQTSHKHQMISEVFLAGASFILACFFIALFFLWRKDRAALHFGFFSLFFSIRVLLVGTRSIIYAFPEINWDVAVRMEYMSMFLMHYSMFHFVYYAFRRQTSRKYLKALEAVTILFLLVCLLPGDYFTYSSIPNNYFLLTTFVYCIYIFAKAIKANVPGAIWAILSMVLFFLTTIPTILEYSNLFITDPVVLNLSYIAFMLSMSLVFASRFSFTFLNLENLKNRERKRNQEIVKQKESIERSNKLINESINYAQRIQQSLLPTQIQLRNIFGESFVFFKPQGTVSGDFYWCRETNKKKEAVLAIADCTGHGVPGAFVSLIAISAMDTLLEKGIVNSPDRLLLELNDVMYERLQKGEAKSRNLKEGMDIALCKFDFEKKTVQFAAAHHKLLLIRGTGEHTIYSGNNHTIGMPLNFDFAFKLEEIELNVGDQIYLFTDGIYDQKGIQDGKKLYLKRFVDVILKNRELPMHRQKIELEEFMIQWMGSKEQMDDMLVFGFEMEQI